MSSAKRKLIIVGSGPAGYTAAIYAARAQLQPLVFTGEKSGGQLMYTTQVENFAGFKDGVLGPQLMMDMRAQAERFGAEMIDRFVSQIDVSQRPFRVMVGEDVYESDAVILATGAESVMLGIPGEDTYMGRGVATCAVCDAAFYRGKKALVVGGGDAAMEDVLALTKFASEVVLLVRSDSLRASRIMQQRVLEDHKDIVSVLWNTEALAVLGDGQKMTGVRLANRKTGEEYEIGADGFFLAIGHRPATSFLSNTDIAVDAKGYIVTRLGLGQESVSLAQRNLNDHGLVAFPTMTSVEGVFAAGDNVDFRYRQAIAAAGHGCMAALDAEWWLERS